MREISFESMLIHSMQILSHVFKQHLSVSRRNKQRAKKPKKQTNKKTQNILVVCYKEV